MSKILNLLKQERYIYLAFICLSFAGLAVAYISEYLFGLKPCILCLYARIPYCVLIILSIIALRFQYKILMFLCRLTLLVEAGIAFFHSGVERGFFEQTKECTKSSHILDPNDLDAVRQMVLQAEVIDCSKPAFVFMGISMTEWNLLYALFILTLSFKFFGVLKSEK